jgi:hypothetical protein
LARQPYVGPGLPQKLLPTEVSGYCFFRFRDKSLFQVGVVSSTPIYLDGLRKTTRNLSQDSMSVGRESKPGPSECEAGVLTTRP